jgi:hypothetical protein
VSSVPPTPINSHNRIVKEHAFLAARAWLRQGSPYYILLFSKMGDLRKTFSEILNTSSRPIRRADDEFDSRLSRDQAISSGPGDRKHR